jgi:N-acyl-phosphatidylethanolamine-hydrolysing phospholipase D
MGGWRKGLLAGVLLTACAAQPATPEIALVGLGPAPRQPDGRFLNLAGPIPHAGPRVTFPFFLRRMMGTFRSRPGAPERIANDGAFLRANAGHSVPTVTWVGHATLLVQMGHRSILTDPTWSNTASPVSFAGPRRFVPPGIEIEALPPIDFVLISHNHYDHLDTGSLGAIAARHPAARFYVPLGNGKILRDEGIENVEELDWGEFRLEGEVKIQCLPSQHWSRRGARDQGRTLWASWAVIGPERRFYFGGDTGYFAGFERIGAALGPFHLAALPIGAYLPAAMMAPWHLTPEEAVRAGRDLRAQRLLAMHFGTFDLSDEPLDEPPRRFRAAGASAGYSEDEAWIFRIGETRRF